MADTPPPPPPGFEIVGVAPPPPPPGFEPIAPAPAAAAPAPVEPTLVDRIMKGASAVADTVGGYGTQAAIGARKGVAALAGLPVDLASLLTNGATWAINKATGSNIPYATNPVGGSDSIDAVLASPVRVVQALTGQPQADPPPRSTGERLTRRIAEEVGAASVPVAGAVAKAGRVGVQGARELSPVARMMVEPAAINPGRFVRREAEAAVTAGVGAGAVNELTGKAEAEAKGVAPTTGQQLGDMGGAVTGVGLLGLTKAVGRPVVSAAGAMLGTPKASDSVIRDVAVDEIARAAGLTPNAKGVIDTGPLADRIARGERVDATIPGYQASTADRSKVPGLAAMEYSRQSGPNSGQYAAQRDANTSAIDTAMDSSKPAGTPGQLSDALDVERNRRIAQASGAAVTASEDAARAVAPITPTTTAGQRGNTIRNEIDTAADTARQATRDAYDAADVNNLPLQPTFLAEALDRTTSGLARAEQEYAPTALINRVAEAPAGQPTTLREATALRTILLDQQRAALADPGRRTEARVLGQYIDAVEDVIGQSVSPDQRALLDQARAARRAEAQAFELKGDPVAQMRARYPGGVPRLSDENVARLTNQDATIGRLLEEADTPATRAAIREQILSNADTSTAAGLYRFQQDFAPQIARFPGLNDELGAAVRARVAETTARGAESETVRQLGEQGRSTVAKYLQYGDERATQAMRGVLSSKDPARAADELLSFVGDDPQAVAGARKVFWDILQKDTRSAGSTTRTISEKQPYLPGALDSFVNDPAIAAVAERLWRDNPEHWDNIKRISESLKGVDVRNSAKAPNTSGTPQGMQSFLPTGETLASRIFAVERGVVSPLFAGINIIGIMARKALKSTQTNAVNQAIDKALLDPDWAAALLRENNPANREALRRATRGWQGHEASTLLNMLQPEDKDAQTKGAVMRGSSGAP